ncbi:hypothetical protein CTAYLR_001656 [Chrysophaeum taylorii]|uniref:Transglutaminase-like domain-containing protein n=1 Tax=Chrysophaeum taylorii TaxID=2483200 RepID=A0AAD7UBZ2_9STRA|nr:hypothetical protein CTAYLR_001656 [Chrysophaeum taylorii]
MMLRAVVTGVLLSQGGSLLAAHTLKTTKMFKERHLRRRATTTTAAYVVDAGTENATVLRAETKPMATYFLGSNETLFQRYLDAAGLTGSIESIELCPEIREHRERAAGWWREGLLIVSDRDAWRHLVRQQTELPTMNAMEAQLEGGAMRAALMWQTAREDLVAARKFLDVELPGVQVTDRKSLQFVLDYFKERFPYYRDKCECCGADGSTFVGEVACVSDEEVRVRRARRAELRVCESCGHLVRFVRANDVARVLRDKRGRCGEYSKAMLSVALALGLPARWVFDTTDHVWVEVFFEHKWIHLDPCEAALDMPNLYASWGKNGSVVVAFESHKAEDVTSKYYPDPASVTTIRQQNNLTDSMIQTILDQYTANSTKTREAYKSSILAALKPRGKPFSHPIPALR